LFDKKISKEGRLGYLLSRNFFLDISEGYLGEKCARDPQIL
jgi:hypothetical protein